MKSEFKEQRDAEFFEAYKKAVKEANGNISLREAIHTAIMTPASSFFISELRIGRIIRASEADAPKSKDKAELFHAIRRRYKHIHANYPNMRPETIAKNFISAQTAPRFYISVARGINIYCTELKRRRKENKK